MNNQITRSLFEYWNVLRADRPAPRREEIEPSELRRILPYVFMLEHRVPDSYRFRLAGTGYCNFYGIEFRGHNMLNQWDDESRPMIRELLNEVLQDRIAGVVDYTARTGDGRDASFELLLLPLADNEGKLTRILGCVSPTEEQPWLGGVMLTEQWVDRIQRLKPRQVDPSSEKARILELHRHRARLNRMKANQPGSAGHTSERPYLRLVREKSAPASQENKPN